MSFLLNPFVFGGLGDMEHIATVTVGSGGASSMEFTSIPQTFKHLQVRVLAQQGSGNAGSGNIFGLLRLNSDATAGNYPSHSLDGNGATAQAGALTGGSYSYAYIAQSYFNTSASSIFGAYIVDVLDYTNTSKNTTIRSLCGWDANGSGVAGIHSAAWLSTAAVTTLTLFPNALTNRTFKEHSTAALYGIRG